MDRIDVGGYHLAYRCGGATTGTPVVFLSALGFPGSYWFETIEVIHSPVTWLIYNRAGVCSSESRYETESHGYLARAEELDRLLRALDFPTPVILVGHSAGALVARMVPTVQPASVAGLVLVESSLDDLGRPPEEPSDIGDGEQLLDAAEGAAEIAGAKPLQVPTAVVSRRPGAWPPHYPDIPGRTRQWTANQQRLVEAYRAEHYVSTRGGHLLPEDDPGLIARAIDSIARRVAKRAAPMAAGKANPA